MANLLHAETEISSRWKERYGIESVAGPLVYVADVNSSLSYFEYKKILVLKEELMEKLKAETDPLKQQRMQMKMLEVNKIEREILLHSTVVFKSLKHK